MKKLTAGILTVMLGIVAANSADASIASKGYVDSQVGTKVSTSDFTTFQTTNTAAIADAKKAGTDASAALDTYKTTASDTFATKTALSDGLAGKQNTLKAGTNIEIKEDGTIGTVGIATTEGLEALETTVAGHTTALGTLNGGADTTGSVANSIANALKDYTTTANMNTALDAKADKTAVAEDLAKKQDKLTAGTNITIGTDGTISSTYAYDDSGVKADVAKNAKAISDMDTAYKAADAAINEKIGNVTEGKTVAEMIADAKSAASGDTTALQARVKTIEDSDVMASGATKEKIDAIATNTTGVAANKTAVEAVAKDLADNYTKTANLSDLAKATIPATCTDPKAANGCALILKNGVYSWEVVERDASENQ